MKRKALTICVFALGALALLAILAGPAAPLLVRLGVEPVCIQGDFPQLRIVACPPPEGLEAASTSIPLPTPEGQTPIPLIFDDDGSPDGMIALLFFLRNPLYRVEAVTVSPGEAHPQLFAGHLVRLLAALGRPNVPAGFGSPSPLEGQNAFPEPWRQTSDAFWDIPLSEAPTSGEPRPAAELIVETVNRSSQPVAIFVSGPHTNLAEALRLDPGIQQRIRAVYVMGGSVYVEGNIERDWPEIQNRVAEWNIWVDPVAADEVFASGLPLHLMPLDGTDRVRWTESEARDWAASGTPEGALAAELLGWLSGAGPAQGVYVWDLAAAVALTDPRLCPQVPLALDVIVEPGPEQGRTAVADMPSNTLVCLEPDAGQVKARAEEILSRANL